MSVSLADFLQQNPPPSGQTGGEANATAEGGDNAGAIPPPEGEPAGEPDAEPEWPDTDQDGDGDKSGEPPGEEPQTEPQTQGDAPPSILKKIAQEQYGVDVSKYASDIELLHGLFNAYKLVGKRSEEAKLLQELRNRFGDEWLMAMLRGELPVQQQQTPDAQRSDEAEVEYDPAWQHQVKYDPISGKLDGPPEVVDKFLRFIQFKESRINEFVKNPKKFLLEALGEEIAKNASSVVQQHLTQAQRAAAFNQWVQDNANLLFQQGNPEELSPIGDWIYRTADWLKKTTGAQDDAAVLMAAGELAKQMLAKQQTTPRPPPPATPAPARRRKTEKLTAADIIRQWKDKRKDPLDLVKVFQILERQ